MREFYMEAEARELLEDFENAFSEAWTAAQDIQTYIDKEYHGDRTQFLHEVAHCCDCFSAADALKTIFEYSEK